MKRQDKAMVIDMSKTSLIPQALKRIQDKVQQITVDTTPEVASLIFENLDAEIQGLQDRINQLKGYFKPEI